jgi:hypothetical protein
LFRRETEDGMNALLLAGVDLHSEYCRLVQELHLACQSKISVKGLDAINEEQAA